MNNRDRFRQWLAANFDDETTKDQIAAAKLFASAQAFACAWRMVPENIKQAIFDALHKPDTEWVEQTIAEFETTYMRVDNNG